MLIITFKRQKCIGCNYCKEIAPRRWQMSKKDGKSNLIGAIDKKGFWTIKLGEEERDENERVANACPVKIIEIR